MKFSEKIKSIQPSATLGITSKAKAMLKSGKDIIILAAGEPDFDTPRIIKEAGIKAIRDGLTKYTPSAGTKSLKEAICRKLSHDNALNYNINEIVVSNGAKHSIYNALQVICNKGDEVLIISPYWLSYPEMVKLAGASPKIVPTHRKNGFKVRIEDLRAALTKNTRALIINSPSNPAGVVYDREELCGIAETCLSNNVTIISDEIYEKIIFDKKKHFSIAGLSNEVRASTIVVNGLSKSFSMTGWRIGYIAADKGIADMVSTLQSHSTSNPCSISQAAAECALLIDLKNEIECNQQEFQKRRDFLMDRLSSQRKILPFKPEGAFYLFCDISNCGLDSETFARRLLDEKEVAVIPGGPFGDDRFIRISFAASIKSIEKGIDRIKDWVRELS